MIHIKIVLCRLAVQIVVKYAAVYAGDFLLMDFYQLHRHAITSGSNKLEKIIVGS